MPPSSSTTRNCRYQQPHLPDECWESVFKHLSDPLDHESLSSSHATSFPSQTASAPTSLFPTVSSLSFPPSSAVFPTSRPSKSRATLQVTSTRSSPKSLLSTCPPSIPSTSLTNPPSPHMELRRFSKKFSNLKSLNCSHTRQDLSLIAECFPNLEEIDASFPKYKVDMILDGDFRIKALTSALKKLRKVTVSGNFTLGDSSIFALCQNCVFLEELVVRQIGSLSKIGFANAIRERPQLRSLAVSCFRDELRIGDLRRGNVPLELIDALVSLKGLTCLDLSYSSISDEALCALAEEGLPLRKLSMPGCPGYGYAGISCLLRKCNNLKYLDLQSTHFLNDQCVIKLSLLLGNLNFVKLSDNPKLTDLSLFAIMRNCRLITEIRMENTGLGKQNLQEDSLVVNSHVKFLYLARNSWLDDRSVTKLTSVCPNLEMMDLSNCAGVSKCAIDVLWSCRKIQRMNLAMLGYDLFQFQFRVCFDVPTLFVLNLSCLSISNEELSLISKSCYKLRELELENCQKITTKGVKQTVKNCQRDLFVRCGCFVGQ